MPDLFDNDNTSRPLAERMRPKTLDGFIGQEHILGIGKPLRKAIENDSLSSIILWGPPGCGKTTLARIIANVTESTYRSFSAVVSGIKEVKDVIAEARNAKKYNGTI